MRLLVLSYCVDEPGLAASNHIDDRLHELAARGTSIAVVGGPSREPGSVMPPANVGLHRVSGSRLRPFGTRTIVSRAASFIRARARAAAEAVGHLGADRFVDWAWADAVVKYARDAIPADTYDLIYSTGGPTAVHLAARTLSAEFKRPWIAELQDPVLFDGFAVEFNASSNDVTFRAAAEDALRAANAVVCLTEACARRYRGRLGTSHVHCIYPGSAISRFSGQAPAPQLPVQGRLRLLHAGSLRGTRSIGPLLDAVCELGLQDRVELILAGSIDRAASRLVRKHASFVRHVGPISRGQTAARIRAADLCVVIQHSGAISSLTIPSKFYEYAALGARILFLGHQNPEAEALSTTCNACFVDQTAPSAVREALRTLIDSPDTVLPARPVPISDATEQFLGLCTTVLLN